MTTTEKYAVIGNPVAHSKSPLIQREFAKQCHKHISYNKILAPVDQFSTHVKAFQQSGGKGLNVTLPFKVQAYQFVDKLGENAKHAGAVNTIVCHRNGTTTGYNTDGLGLIRDITLNHQCPINSKSILLIGAGGAALGVINALLAQRPASLIITNRTFAKAQQLQKHFQKLALVHHVPRFMAIRLDHLYDKQFDIIINATSASLNDQLLPLPKSIIKAEQTCCYDMVYGSKPTVFLKWCQQQHAGLTLDGYGMLVEQAAESFHIWHGKYPDTKPLLEKRI